MARCIPFPPPGYTKNGLPYEAWLESIKLQKEAADKAKADMKKKKKENIEKKEKRENENRKKDEKLNLTKKQILDSGLADEFKETHFKELKIDNVQLDMSGLTEEHGKPIQPSHSSKSTHNTNKRIRDDGDDDALLLKSGMPIEIILSKKPKGSDSTNSGEDTTFNTAPRTLHGVPTSLTQKKSNPCLERSKISNPSGSHADREQASTRPILPSGLKNSNVKVLKSSRQHIGSSALSMKTSNANGLQVGREQAPASTSFTRLVLPSRLQNNDDKVLKSSRKQIGSSDILPNQGFKRSKTSDSNEFIPLGRKHAPVCTSNLRPNLPYGPKKSNVVEGLKSSRQQTGSSAYLVGSGHLKQEVLNSSVSRTIGAYGLNCDRQQQGLTNLKPSLPGLNLNKPGQSSRRKRPISEVTVTEGPSTELKQKKGPTSWKSLLPGPTLNKPGPSSIEKRPICGIIVSDGPSIELEKKRGLTNLKPPLPGRILNKSGSSSTSKLPISEATVHEGPSMDPKTIKGPTNLKPPLPGMILNKMGPSSTRNLPIGEIIVSECTSAEMEKNDPTNLTPQLPSLILKKPGPSSIEKQPISVIPSSDDPSIEPEKKMQVGPTRSEKTILKAEYEKLMGSLDPAAFQALQPPSVGDEDWLSRRTKTANPSKSRDEVKTCELPTSTLWQPCAHYLAEVDIYALPYTIPF